jgi:hypothetical protein
MLQFHVPYFGFVLCLFLLQFLPEFHHARSQLANLGIRSGHRLFDMFAFFEAYALEFVSQRENRFFQQFDFKFVAHSNDIVNQKGRENIGRCVIVSCCISNPKCRNLQ